MHKQGLATGFTLLEMVIVLAIMILLTGVAVISFDSMGREQELRRPVTELQRMTQEAVRRAGTYERSQTITFDSSGFAMRYKSHANGKIDGDDRALWERRVDLPRRMKLTLRRFGATKFTSAAGQQLVIRPGGICEPLTARFEIGSAWIEVALDPLSGGMREETMNIQ
jgi:type II secretory pathway pseudopilin PulG